MQITFFGHSEFYLEMEGDNGETLRLLSDSWFSDYAFGDFMARNPKLNINFKNFPPIDFIYLTHPHCDHFDPYSLVELFRHQQPEILLPETSLFFKSLLEEYLQGVKIRVLKNNEETILKGVRVRGISYPNHFHTNEDDVMMLLLCSRNESLFYEVDAALPDDHEVYVKLKRLFTSKDTKNHVYLATRNELEALFIALDAEDVRERNLRLKEYRKKRKLEMKWNYRMIDQWEDEQSDLWSIHNLTKILLGQGIIFPPSVNEEYLRLQAPYSLKEVAEDEREIAKRSGRDFQIHPQSAGKIYKIENGAIKEITTPSYLKDATLYPLSYDDKFLVKRDTLDRPVKNDKRNVPLQKEMILDYINHRFFPFQIASLEEPLKLLLLKNRSRSYVIAVKYGTLNEHTLLYYVYNFTSQFFCEFTDWNEKIDEMYWANDLDDHLSGRQDLFSTTLHHLNDKYAIRLWNVMGIPFLNNDIIEKKLRYHFERASCSESLAEWVLSSISENIVVATNPSKGK